MPRGRTTKANRDEVLEDYKRGDTVASIAKRHGCGPATVSRWAEEAGIGRGKGGGPNSGAEQSPSPKALAGGAWISDGRGVKHWVEGATA